MKKRCAIYYLYKNKINVAHMVTLIFNNKKYICKQQNLFKSLYLNKFSIKQHELIIDIPILCSDETFENIVFYINDDIKLDYYKVFPIKHYDNYLEIINYLRIDELEKILLNNLMICIKFPYLINNNEIVVSARQYLSNKNIKKFIKKYNQFEFLNKYLVENTINYDKLTVAYCNCLKYILGDIVEQIV